MNVLEIYPNFSWWFEAANSDQIEQLRAAVRLHTGSAQAELFEELAPAKAFHLVGDAATFDLLPGVFDEIIVHYSPTPLKRLNLEGRMRLWMTPEGTYRIAPDFTAEGDERNEEEDIGRSGIMENKT